MNIEYIFFIYILLISIIVKFGKQKIIFLKFYSFSKTLKLLKLINF